MTHRKKSVVPELRVRNRPTRCTSHKYKHPKRIVRWLAKLPVADLPDDDSWPRAAPAGLELT